MRAFPCPFRAAKGSGRGIRGIVAYKDNLQGIISEIRAAGRIPCLAKVPYADKPSIDIPSIREYNVVIDELVAENNITVTPPDFYAYFQQHQDEIPDGIHPDKIGYESTANLWFHALTRMKAPLPSK